MKNHIKAVITINNTDSGHILAEFFSPQKQVIQNLFRNLLQSAYNVLSL